MLRSMVPRFTVPSGLARFLVVSGMRRVVGTCLAAGLLMASPSSVRADEGQWMPEQIADLDQAKLKELGLELEPKEIWDPAGGGLLSAIVNLSGCSAGFVSDRGLVATNHHCAHAAIQAQSSVEHDYLTDGFLAQTPDQELEAKGRTVKVLQAVEDVSAKIRAAATSEDPAERKLQVERAMKEEIAACEAPGGGLRCDVHGFYNGSVYQLMRYLEFRDVRLVYAPPSSVGNYGGEVDNWMWPRHTGDFTLLRVYTAPDGSPAPYAEDNIPYTPKRWLEVSPDGVGPGDFVAVLGYPGHTDRYLPAPEAERRLEQSLPALVELYGRWIEILEEKGAADPAVKIKVAATLRGLANRHKNSRGMIEGINRLGLLERRKAEHEKLVAWAKSADAKYGTVLPALADLATERREGFDRDFLIGNVSRPCPSRYRRARLGRRGLDRSRSVELAGHAPTDARAEYLRRDAGVPRCSRHTQEATRPLRP